MSTRLALYPSLGKMCMFSGSAIVVPSTTYTMGPLSILYPHLDDIALHLYFFFSLLTYSPEFRLYIHTYPHTHTHTPSYPHTYPTFLSVISVRLIFLPCPLFFFHAFPTYYKKTPPVGLEPTTLRLKAARSTD